MPSAMPRYRAITKVLLARHSDAPTLEACDRVKDFAIANDRLDFDRHQAPAYIVMAYIVMAYVVMF